MPIPATVRLPPPTSHQEFELLATDVLREIWKDPHVQMYGAPGQKQCGIDAYGRVAHLGGKRGVAQFTVGTELLPKLRRDLAAMDAEYPDKPALFLMCVTAQLDTRVQDQVRQISASRAKDGLCEVDILFWETIASHVAGNRNLMAKYYSHWGDAEDRPARQRADELLNQARASAFASDATSSHIEVTFALEDDVDVRAARLLVREERARFVGERAIVVTVPHAALPEVEMSENVFFRSPHPGRKRRQR